MSDRPTYVSAEGKILPLSDAMFEQWQVDTAAGQAASNDPPLPPDGPSLGDWRIALRLWGRFDDLQAKAKALLDSGDPLGIVVDERLNRANFVYRAELMALKDALGFTAADVDESLRRADKVAKGEYS